MSASTTMPVHDPPLRCFHCGGDPHSAYHNGPRIAGCPAIPEGYILSYEYLTLSNERA